MDVGRGDSGEGRKPGRGCPYCPGCCCCCGGRTTVCRPGMPICQASFAHGTPGLVNALNPKESEKSHGMLNATSTMCFTGLKLYAALRGMTLHLEASSWQIQARANSGGCWPGGPGIPGLCPGGPRG